MTVRDWAALNARYARESKTTGESIKSWCKKNNLNYSTARRHIRKPKTKDSLADAKTGQFQPGNQAARNYGHYTEFITTPEDVRRYESAEKANLKDDQCMLRTQLSNALVATTRIEADLASGKLSAELRIEAYRAYVRLQDVCNHKFARIESIDNSLVSQRKMIADTEKNIVLTEKAKLEVELLSNKTGDGKKTLYDIYEDILAREYDGMLNKKK